MSHFLFIASDITPFEGDRLKAPEVYDLMMSHKCWELTERSPHRREMEPGDIFMFYLGGTSGRYVAGEARLAGLFEAITAKSATTFNRNQVPFFTLRAPLDNIVRYEPGRVKIDTIAELSFAKNSTVERKYIGLLLRSGVRKLTDEDVELIRSRARVTV